MGHPGIHTYSSSPLTLAYILERVVYGKRVKKQGPPSQACNVIFGHIIGPGYMESEDFQEAHCHQSVWRYTLAHRTHEFLNHGL